MLTPFRISSYSRPSLSEVYKIKNTNSNMNRETSSWSVVLSTIQPSTTRRPIYPIWEVITCCGLRHDFSSLRKKFGYSKAIVLILFFPNTAQIVDQIEKHVLGAKGDEAITYRESILGDCTRLSVAVCFNQFCCVMGANTTAGCCYGKCCPFSFGSSEHS